MLSRQRGGKSFLTLDADAKLLPPVAGAAARTSASRACRMAGRLLVFALDEIKLQSNGGRGLTLMDVDAKDPLVSVAAFGDALKVHRASAAATSRRKKSSRGAALELHVGKRARKGRKVHGFKKVLRVVAPG